MTRAEQTARPTPSARQRGAQLAQFVHDSLVASARQASIPTVTAIAALLVQRDGDYLVAGQCFTDPTTATAERLRVAHGVRLDMLRGCSLTRAMERGSARRLWMQGERTCAWCERPILSLNHAEELGLALVHHGCAVEFGA